MQKMQNDTLEWQNKVVAKGAEIETLNRKAHDAVYDLTAISFHAYPYIQDNYTLLSCGGSVGEGYGPMIIATRGFSL